VSECLISEAANPALLTDGRLPNVVKPQPSQIDHIISHQRPIQTESTTNQIGQTKVAETAQPSSFADTMGLGKESRSNSLRGRSQQRSNYTNSENSP